MYSSSKVIVLAVAAILLVGSLFAAGKSFAIPANKTVTQQVKLVDYQQSGTFDYAATMKPSFFYGNAPATTPSPTAPIPTAFIDTFQVNFSYISSGTSGKGIDVSAILENPGVWKKSIPLASQNGTGVRSVSFPLDLSSLQDTADAINKEIGVAASSLDVTLQAEVPDGTTSAGGSPADFVQTLPLTVTKTFVTIGDTLTSEQSGTSGTFSYQVKLLDNDLYGPVTITPPTASTGPQVVLGPKDTVFTQLLDSLKFSYSYQFTATRPVDGEKTEVGIDAIAAGDKWSKTYVLLPPTQETSDFSVSFPLELDQYTAIFNAVQRETGAMSSSENLTLQATVHTVGQTASGPIDRTLVQTIGTDLRSGVMTWAGEMQDKSPGSIDTTHSTIEPAKLWGTTVSEVRVISGAVAGIMLVFLGTLLLAYYLRRPSEAALVAEKARGIDRKYKAMIVQVTEAPNGQTAETILPVDSVEDLIKVGQGLLKPVHHNATASEHVYWVYDDTKRYEYRLGNGKATQGEQVESTK